MMDTEPDLCDYYLCSDEKSNNTSMCYFAVQTIIV
jgi:hypothetical protein